MRHLKVCMDLNSTITHLDIKKKYYHTPVYFCVISVVVR